MKEDIPYYQKAQECCRCAHREIKHGRTFAYFHCTKYDARVEGDCVCYDYEPKEP